MNYIRGLPGGRQRVHIYSVELPDPTRLYIIHVHVHVHVQYSAHARLQMGPLIDCTLTKNA